MRYKGSGVSWKRFVSTQVLFNLIEFPFVYRTIKILASMEKRRCTFNHEFDPSSKIKKKKKKEKKMTTRRTKFDYFLQGNFKQWIRWEAAQFPFNRFPPTSINKCKIEPNEWPNNIRSYDDVSCPRYSNLTKEIARFRITRFPCIST